MILELNKVEWGVVKEALEMLASRDSEDPNAPKARELLDTMSARFPDTPDLSTVGTGEEETTLDQVDEVWSLAWTDATHLPPSEEKEELCRRMRHAADYLDELRERA